MNKSVWTRSTEMETGGGSLTPELSLAELIRSQRASSEQIRGKLKELGQHHYYAYPAVALCDVGAEDRSATHLQIEFLELRLALERNAQGSCAVFPDPVGGYVGILFSWDNKPLLERLHEMTLTLVNTTSARTLTIGIGNPYQQLSDLHHSLRQAEAALEHKFYTGAQQMIYYSHLKPFSVVDKYPDEQENRLFSLMQEQALEAIEPAVEDYYEALLDGGQLPCNEVKNATIRLLIGLELRIRASANQQSNVIKPDLVSILQMDTLSEIKLNASRFIEQMIDMNATNEGMQSGLIKKALTLMENEYDKATLHSVAEKVFLTPAYLSSLFKMNMGVTFIEHLTDIRIAKAKKLLQQTCLKNYEVAELVGYQDSRYFSQIFKKKVGLSPSEFRDSILLAN